MRTYIIRRLLLMIPTVFLVTLVVFFTIRLIPGTLVDIMVGRYTGYGPVDRAAIERSLGLDVPMFTQYGRWIGTVPQADGSFGGLFQGNLGTSLLTGTPVADEILNKWPITFELGLLGLIIGQLVALPIGIYSALRQDTWGDFIARSFAILCMALPAFWIGTMIIVFPSIWWGWSPPIILIRFTKHPIVNLEMFIIPSIVVGMEMMGTTMRMTRTMMLEVLREEYIRTAWAKGLRERVVVIRHALRNALIPIVSLIGLRLPVLIGGVVIIEQIFCLPGIGRLGIDAAAYRDYPVVSGVLIFFGVGMVLINLMVDLTYGFLDPRIRYQ